MSIKFHCEHCGKKIEAQDIAGGKWGQCPGCHNKIYVPSPNVGEELKVSPVDESDQEKQQRLMDETHKITQDILLEREPPNGLAETAGPPSKINDKQLTENIIAYLRQMADGNLDEAERILRLIIRCGNRAVKALDRIALSEMPEALLTDIPPQVLSSLIRNLRNRVS